MQQRPSRHPDDPLATAYHIGTFLSIALFLYYGAACLFAEGMVEEFERFGLARLRRLTGMLELLGATGLAVGYLIPVVTLISATGLTLLMALGVVTRIRVRDSFIEIVPAAALGLINLYIVLYSVT